MKTHTSQSGAALLEFAIVAAVLLAILLPGMISVGKSLAELNAAAQGAYLGGQLAAEESMDLGVEPTAAQQSQVNQAVADRIGATFPSMSAATTRVTTGTLLHQNADPSHWMVASTVSATFPVILTDIPITVRSVGSMLNMQAPTTSDLSTPQRIIRSGRFSTYTCQPRACDVSANVQNCDPICCIGYRPNGLRTSCNTRRYGVFNSDEDDVSDDSPGNLDHLGGEDEANNVDGPG